MRIRTTQQAVEVLWRRGLSDYRQDGLRERLREEWPGDRNVNARIAYQYPPTFQPGSVGPRYFDQGHGIVLMGQNPGEGSDRASIEMNREYLSALMAFSQGDIGFEDLNSESRRTCSGGPSSGGRAFSAKAARRGCPCWMTTYALLSKRSATSTISL